MKVEAYINEIQNAYNNANGTFTTKDGVELPVKFEINAMYTTGEPKANLSSVEIIALSMSNSDIHEDNYVRLDKGPAKESSARGNTATWYNNGILDEKSGHHEILHLLGISGLVYEHNHVSDINNPQMLNARGTHDKDGNLIDP